MSIINCNKCGEQGDSDIIEWATTGDGEEYLCDKCFEELIIK